VTDCRLLLLPVKSQKGVCAWVTCPRVVTKFSNEMAQVGAGVSFSVSENTASSNATVIGTNKIGIEEFVYENVNVDDETKKFAKHVATQFFAANDYMHALLCNNVVVLTDDDFGQLTELCTEVITRTKINNETGTVQSGALFNEEYLPQESVLYSLVFFENEFRKDGLKNDKVKAFFDSHLPKYFQLGGNATIGKGIVKTNLKP
jgi:CRISPR-associated protein Cmr4